MYKINRKKEEIILQLNNLKYKKKIGLTSMIIRILLLITIVIPLCMPLALNAKEPIQDIKNDLAQTFGTGQYSSKASSAPSTKYAKNTAYGKSKESQDNATGVIEVNAPSISDINYKINAITHEIIIRLTLSKEIISDTYTFSMNVEDDSGHFLEIVEGNTEADTSPGYIKEIGDTTDSIYEYEISTESLEDLSFSQKGQYEVWFQNTDGTNMDIVEVPETDDGFLTLEVPKTKTIDGKLYSLIGDSINANTDIDDAITSDVVNPSTVGNSTIDNTKKAYGIYELESIGYEESNGDSSTSSKKADWSDKDLTLTKYDHVIRPMNVNYLIADDIDATVTNQTTLTLDEEGGWSTDTDADNFADLNDGFRPIGQVVGSTTDDSVAFTGKISGDVDNLCGSSNCTNSAGVVVNKSDIENTYINKLYINEESTNDIGMISIGDDVEMDNLGMVDPKIIGKARVGSFAGQLKDSDLTSGEGTKLTNVYALESSNDELAVVWDIVSKESTLPKEDQGAGGIAGQATDTTINSQGRAEGDIRGINLTTDIQPNKTYPDRDGYKTFNTLDVQSQNSQAGGIIGQGSSVKIDRAYNKGNLEADSEVGGLAGVLKDSEVSNSYNTAGKISTTSKGIVGGIIGLGASNTSVLNTYNLGDITEEYGYVGGIAGQGENIQISNAINYGLITGGYAVGGILGGAQDSSAIINIQNTINQGPIIASSVESPGNAYVGGIVGYGTEDTTSNIKNSVNKEDVSATDSSVDVETVGAVIGYSNLATIDSLVTNSYYTNGITIYPGDGTTKIYREIEMTSISNVKEVSWWQNILFENDPNNYSNFNITVSDAQIPVPDSDVSDESQDDAAGNIENSLYPTLKEKFDASASDKLEIPEQTTTTIPDTTYTTYLKNYKIDSQTLDIYVEIFTDETIVKSISQGKIKLFEGVHPTGTTPSGEILDLTFNIEVGSSIVKLPGTSILPDTDYTILFFDDKDVEIGRVIIHTPKQYEDADGVVYALIGDGVNQDTYVGGDITDSTYTKPSTVANSTLGDGSQKAYGIYELESIAYESASGEDADSDAATDNTTDWSEDDLTLYKYDHIIRPASGNYMVIQDIDASVTQESIPKVDAEGGWSTKTTMDGFRPIGQNQWTRDGRDSVEFTGILKGYDEADPSNSKIINNIYIDGTNLFNIGFISELGTIDQEGKVEKLKFLTTDDLTDPSTSTHKIIGSNEVGGLVGVIHEKGIVNDIGVEIVVQGKEIGNGKIGGIVGENNGKVYNSYYKGDIEAQVGGEDANVGGIAGENNSEINNCYTQLELSGPKNVGGIAGVNAGTIFASYSHGNALEGTSIGGITGLNSGSLLDVYSTINIDIKSSGSAGGLVGKNDTSGTITSSFATGSIIGESSSVMGGLIGTNLGTLTNSYSYANQYITRAGLTLGIIEDGSTGNANIVGNEPSSTYPLAQYSDLTNRRWYTKPLTKPGLEWMSSDVEYEEELDYTAPYPKPPEYEKFCFPQVYADSDISGDFTGNTGEYVKEQECVEIPKPSSLFGITNFKIDAMTLDITLKVDESMVVGDQEITVKEDGGSSITKTITPTTTPEGVFYKLNKSDYNIEDNTDYLISRYGQPVPFRIHTPSQKIIDGKTYALIGDNINLSSDIELETGTDKVYPGSDAPFGIEELESIGYEDVNTADWSEDDLTLYKYNHITRPIDGNYLVANTINAQRTFDDSREDKNGGYSTDGFRPIGQKIDTTTGNDSTPFTGELTGDVVEYCGEYSCGLGEVDPEGGILDEIVEVSKIKDLLISQPTFSNVGVVAINEGNINSFGVGEDSQIIGKDQVGGVIGDNRSTIYNVFATEEAEITGENEVGGIVGLNENSSSIIGSYSYANVTGIESVGGVVGSSFNGGDIANTYYGNLRVEGENQVGGIAGEVIGAGEVNRVYSSGIISGVNSVGGLVGHSEVDIINSYGDNTINGSGSGVGTIVGSKSSGTLTNNYVYEESLLNGVKANESYEPIYPIYIPKNEIYTVQFWNNTLDFNGYSKTTDAYTVEVIHVGFYPFVNNLDATGNVIVTTEIEEQILSYQMGAKVPTPDIENVSSCKDLESIGRGENYPGASHTEEWYTFGWFEFTNNVDCSATNPTDILHDSGVENTYGDNGFNPIGTKDQPFTGTIIGGGYEIQNVYINSNSTQGVGLFGNTFWATLNNFTLNDSDVTATVANKGTGGVVGYAKNTTFDKVGAVGGSVKGKDQAGGLVGSADGAKITNSYSKINTEGFFNVGGLVGYGEKTNMYNSYSAGAVKGHYQAGGLFGRASEIVISNAYTSGTVTVTGSDAGGLVGYGQGLKISNVYSIADITSTSTGVDKTRIGGLMGFMGNGRMTNAYYEGMITGSRGTRVIAGDFSGTRPTYFTNINVYGDTLVSTTRGSTYKKARTIELSPVYDASYVYEEEIYSPAWWVDTLKFNLYNTDDDRDPDDYYATGGYVADDTNHWTVDSYVKFKKYPHLNMSDNDDLVGTNVMQSKIPTEEVPEQSLRGLVEGHPVSTCKDLESIGKGENYPGASHYEAWGLEESYILTSNIDCSATNPTNPYHDTSPENTYGADGFDPIGSSFSDSFTGTIDGGNNSVDNIYINKDSKYTGLFGVSQGGTFTNLGINGGSVEGADEYVGGLVGIAYVAEVYNCYVKLDSVKGGEYVGGMMGTGANATNINNSYTNTAVTGSGSYVGGIGGQYDGVIQNSYSSGTVRGAGYVAGIVGGPIVGQTLEIQNTYSVAFVESTKSEAAGIVCRPNSRDIINNVYFGGTAVGGSNTGVITSATGYEQSNTFSWEGTKISQDFGKTYKTVENKGYTQGGPGHDEYDPNRYSPTKEQIYDPEWWVNTAHFNNFDNDGDGDTTDEQTHWVIDGLVNYSSTEHYYPHVNSLTYDPGFTNIASGTHEVPKQSDKKFDEKKAVYTCKDLESIGKGADYPGATHTDAWTVSDSYELKRNINCSATNPASPDHDTSPTTTYGDDGFDPIGKEKSNTFAGVIEGNNHTINNIYIKTEDSDEDTPDTGVIAKMDAAEIRNLGIIDGTVISTSTSGTVGGMSGSAVNSKIINSYYQGEVQGVVDATTGAGSTGGLIGTGDSIELVNSYSNVDVRGNKNVGGLVGHLTGPSVYKGDDSNLRNVYARGSVEGHDNVGGLVGYVTDTTNGVSNIYNSYANIDVKSTGTNSYAGGIVAKVASPTSSGGTAPLKAENVLFDGTVSSTRYGSIIGSYSGKYLNTWAYNEASLSTDGGMTWKDASELPGNVASKSQITDLTWWENELLFNNFDIEADGDILDDKMHWKLDGLVNNVTPFYPHVNAIQYTGIDLKDYESTSIEVPNQDNYTIVEPVKGIKTCKDLESIGKGANYPGAEHKEAWTVNGDYKLLANIDCSATNPSNPSHDSTEKTTYGADGFDPVGTSETPFSGTIDGQNYTISNIYINNDDDITGGIFNYTVEAIIKNIGVIGADITNTNIAPSTVVGGIVGKGISSEITNSYVLGKIEAQEGSAGGIVGEGQGIKIYNSYTTADVKGATSAGGIVGKVLEQGTGYESLDGNSYIKNTYSTGTIMGDSTKTKSGGIVGESGNSAILEIIAGYSLSDITGQYIGGIIGDMGDTTTVKNVFYQGMLTGKDIANIGTITSGEADYASITNTAVDEDSKIGSEDAGGVLSYQSAKDIVGGAIVDDSVNNNILVSSTEYKDPVWWENNLEFNNIDIDVDTDLGDDETHWDITTPVGSSGFPFLNKIEYVGESISDMQSTLIPLANQILDTGGALKEIKTCRDLESIGRGADYPGTTHMGVEFTNYDEYEIVNDIDCSATNPNNDNYDPIYNGGFEPIGSKNEAFSGVINGNGYEIDGLFIKDVKENPGTGIFSRSNNAEFYDFGVTNFENEIDNSPNAVFSGYSDNSIFMNVYAKDGILENPGSDSKYGGIMGEGSENKIYNSYVDLEIKGGSIGGIAYANTSGEIKNVYTVGNLENNTSDGSVGGIEAKGVSNIEGVYSLVDIDNENTNSNQGTGGIVGEEGVVKGAYYGGNIKGGVEESDIGLIGPEVDSYSDVAAYEDLQIARGEIDYKFAKNAGLTKEAGGEDLVSATTIRDEEFWEDIVKLNKVDIDGDGSYKGEETVWDLTPIKTGNYPRLNKIAYEDEEQKDITALKSTTELIGGQPASVMPISENTEAEVYVEDAVQELEEIDIKGVDVSQNQKAEEAKNNIIIQSLEAEEEIIDEEYYPSIKL